jgi:citrate lyase subunit gamma (acyl carrier protein)
MGSTLKTAQAGTLESGDIMLIVAPASAAGITIELESIVFPQYGQAIMEVLQKTVAQHELTGIYIKAIDRGALDCTIKARVLTALARAGAVLKEELL